MTAPNLVAHLVTARGSIRINLFAEQCPLTVANFCNLARRKYYDGLTFHRVIPDFMIQGGCPQGSGRGGPGYQFADECKPMLRHDVPGVLSMANAGPGTNGSQFFITHVATPWLDGKHTVFGKVQGAEDLAVVNAVAGGDRIDCITIEGDTNHLFAEQQSQIEQWNRVLDAR
ncbi:MAG: peptidylprolyl isomerase [Lysobacterales bacterium CG02_land_8_20_14_3_00_62_12]|nr:MAG: peptidylprolyl isomerase [Xanthomonadales bacterium CG02_land_8_20_14_3_00_62_12]PJA42448.1 MAG: peptidylprolyl isomerase [Xanthomonadales bacterium CG_4_9_14_3_um_filter_62_6]